MNIILITKEVLFMDDWNKFSGNDESSESHYQEGFSQESFSSPESKKPKKIQKE